MEYAEWKSEVERLVAELDSADGARFACASAAYWMECLNSKTDRLYEPQSWTVETLRVVDSLLSKQDLRVGVDEAWELRTRMDLQAYAGEHEVWLAEQKLKPTFGPSVGGKTVFPVEATDFVVDQAEPLFGSFTWEICGDVLAAIVRGERDVVRVLEHCRTIAGHDDALPAKNQHGRGSISEDAEANAVLRQLREYTHARSHGVDRRRLDAHRPPRTSAG